MKNFQSVIAPAPLGAGHHIQRWAVDASEGGDGGGGAAAAAGRGAGVPPAVLAEVCALAHGMPEEVWGVVRRCGGGGAPDGRLQDAWSRMEGVAKHLVGEDARQDAIGAARFGSSTGDAGVLIVALPTALPKVLQLRSGQGAGMGHDSSRLESPMNLQIGHFLCDWLSQSQYVRLLVRR